MTAPATDLRAQFPLLAAGEMHYLDSAAMAQIPQAVLDAMQAHETMHRANVHRGVHRLAEAATAAYEQARTELAAYLGVADPGEIIFTPGCTAAINLVAASWGGLLAAGDEIIITELDHHANIVPWQMLAQRRGVVLRVLPVTDEGRLDLARLPALLGPRTRLIAAPHVSNVTGAISDVVNLAAAARSCGAKLLLDGAQAAPHGPLDLPGLGCDFYALSGHKLFGPTGIGVLWARAEILSDMPPWLGGGGMIRRVSFAETLYAPPPQRFEAGTPPITQAVGLAAACRWAAALDWPTLAARERDLTQRMITGLEAAGATLLGPRGTEGRHGVVSFTLPGIHPHDIAQILDRHRVAVRGGHHCCQPLLARFDLAAVTRASLAPYCDAADITAFLIGINDSIAIFS